MSSFGSTPQRGSSSFGVGGTTLPNTEQIAQQQFQAQNRVIAEARRVAGNQQAIAEKQARSQQARKDFLKQRQQVRANVLNQVQQQQGRQEARVYQQRIERAVKLGERTPLPEGVNVDLTDQGELDKLREAGFDVPRRVPAGGGGGGGFPIPSGNFEVDRVAQGNDVQDTARS